MVKLAIDVMGGDHAPAIVFGGLDILLRNSKLNHVHFHLFATQPVIQLYQHKYQTQAHRIQFIACSEVVSGKTEPRLAIRELKDSTMRRAIEHVAQGQADGVVSAGNTGAYMVLSKLILKTLEGIHRPAITGILPGQLRPTVMLDIGANVEVTPEVMMQFCLMGQAFAKAVLNRDNPTVALLNVGSEELKGKTIIKEVQQLIGRTNIIKNYCGYVEGNDLFTTDVDVIVTDGFTGNIALKTIEGTAEFFSHTLKAEINKSWLYKIGALLIKPAINAFKARLDPRMYNGAPFMGLKGISVKSHGGTDDIGFANAMRVAINLIDKKFNLRLKEEVALLQQHLEILPFEEIH